MNTNADMPAMPMDNVSSKEAEEGYYYPFSVGLTKREHFAGLAMQSILEGRFHQRGGVIGTNNFEHHIAKDSIKMADALLAALEKSE